MVYFAAVGHFLNESGGPHDTGILAAGSMRGFSRYKQLHPMLAAAFQALYFSRFVAEQVPISITQQDQLQMVNSAGDM